jgi:hypothetical protein
MGEGEGRGEAREEEPQDDKDDSENDDDSRASRHLHLHGNRTRIAPGRSVGPCLRIRRLGVRIPSGAHLRALRRLSDRSRSAPHLNPCRVVVEQANDIVKLLFNVLDGPFPIGVGHVVSVSAKRPATLPGVSPPGS